MPSSSQKKEKHRLVFITHRHLFQKDVLLCFWFKLNSCITVSQERWLH